MIKKGRHVLIDEKSKIGKDTVIWHFVNIYNSKIGDKCTIGSFVVIGGAQIGDACKIEDFAFIPPGSKISNRVIIGPHTALTNDKFSSIGQEWKQQGVTILEGAWIGANCTILPGITIGKKAKVGGGSTVADDVPEGAVVYGHKARAWK